MGTSEVSQQTGLSLRQLQWWDECGFLRPEIKRGRRCYSPEQVSQLRMLARFRRAGISPRNSLRLLGQIGLTAPCVVVMKSGNVKLVH